MSASPLWSSAIESSNPQLTLLRMSGALGGGGGGSKTWTDIIRNPKPSAASSGKSVADWLAEYQAGVDKTNAKIDEMYATARQDPIESLRDPYFGSDIRGSVTGQIGAALNDGDYGINDERKNKILAATLGRMAAADSAASRRLRSGAARAGMTGAQAMAARQAQGMQNRVSQANQVRDLENQIAQYNQDERKAWTNMGQQQLSQDTAVMQAVAEMRQRAPLNYQPIIADPSIFAQAGQGVGANSGGGGWANNMYGQMAMTAHGSGGMTGGSVVNSGQTGYYNTSTPGNMYAPYANVDWQKQQDWSIPAPRTDAQRRANAQQIEADYLKRVGRSPSTGGGSGAAAQPYRPYAGAEGGWGNQFAPTWGSLF